MSKYPHKVVIVKIQNYFYGGEKRRDTVDYLKVDLPTNTREKSLNMLSHNPSRWLSRNIVMGVICK